MLLPQDIVVALKLAVADRPSTYAELARELDMSASQVHAAVGRCGKAGLIRRDSMLVNTDALLELALYGVKYVYPAELLPKQRGIPTAYSASPLNDHIRADELLVWPDPDGEVRGDALAPIHKSVPNAARKDPKLYQALSLLDAIRVGRSRERKLAEDFLTKLLHGGNQKFSLHAIE